MRSRRILWVISSLSAGGAERVITELANAFVDHGHSVAVLTLAQPGRDHYQLDSRIERIALNVIWDSVSLWQSFVGNWRRIRMIREAILRYQPDVVVSFIEQNNVRVLSAMLGARIPIIVSERIDPRRYQVGRIWNVARRLLYPFADRVVVQTEGVANWARAITDRKRVRVVPNFVRTLPQLHGDRRETMQLLAVGRLDSQKAFDVLLRAFALSALAERGVTLTILGDGPQRQALGVLADELGIAQAVEMPGVVQNPEAWMARTTVFVLPSRYEGFPNALLEAMAMGCPVIAADCDSGPREIIRHGENGLLVPVEDIDALAAALQKLFDDVALRTWLGAEALNIRERYSKHVIVDQWEKLIEEVVE